VAIARHLARVPNYLSGQAYLPLFSGAIHLKIVSKSQVQNMGSEICSAKVRNSQDFAIGSETTGGLWIKRPLSHKAYVTYMLISDVH
jgi:hypothetical protein